VSGSVDCTVFNSFHLRSLEILVCELLELVFIIICCLRSVVRGASQWKYRTMPNDAIET
jgi:hypothetical protein